MALFGAEGVGNSVGVLGETLARTLLGVPA